MTAQEYAERLGGTLSAEPGQRSCMVRCPAHKDHTPSLSITKGADGRVLVKCFAGCTFEQIVAASGLKQSDFMPPVPPQAPSKAPIGTSRIVATYPYMDKNGKLVFEVVRFEPKDFRQRRPDGHGGSVWNMTGVTRVLYRLPDVLKAKASGETIFVTEGEKDAEALVKLGLCATTNAGGAVKWEPQYTEALTGAKVVVLPDKDEAGRRHMALVLRELGGKAESLKVVELPDRNQVRVKDAADWVAAGGTREELDKMVLETPVYNPDATEGGGTECAAAAATADDFQSIRAELWEIAQERKASPTERNRSSAEAVVRWLHGRGKFYYHHERRDFASAMFFDATRKLLLSVRSDEFTGWLADCLGVNRAETLFKFVSAAVETEGLSERSQAIDPSLFWAARDGAIYLSNGPGQMVKLTAGRVELVDNGTDSVLFPVGATLVPWKLTEPADPFEKCSIFKGISALAKHGWELLRLWACSLLTDQKTKPPLVLTGPPGSGKTRVIRGLFELFGLTERVTAVLKNGESDFWTNLDAGGLACFDNADTKIEWLPDALAAAATAGSCNKRKLYSDSVLVTQRARAWAAVTSAVPNFASDAGLADRLIVIRLGRREGDRADSILSEEIAQARDAGLSWICHILAKALADKEPVPGGLNGRHPDFAAMAVRIGRAMGRGDEAIAALRAAEADKSLFNIENDTVGAALFDLLRHGPFQGTANDLMVALRMVDPSFASFLSAKRIGTRLAKLWSHLEAVFGATKELDAHTKTTVYSFKGVDAGSAGSETVFPAMSLVKGDIESLPKTALRTPQTPQPHPQGGRQTDDESEVEDGQTYLNVEEVVAALAKYEVTLTNRDGLLVPTSPRCLPAQLLVALRHFNEEISARIETGQRPYRKEAS